MLPLSWIDALFLKFESFYGASFAHKWKGANVDAVKLEWAEGLGRFNGETIKRALYFLRENNPHPPSLPEFILICKSLRVDNASVLHLIRRHEISLEGLAKLEEIKKMLSKKMEVTK